MCLTVHRERQAGVSRVNFVPGVSLVGREVGQPCTHG